MTKRIAVVGAGGMARVRTRALLATGGVSICGVASRRLSSARRFGREVGCASCFDDFTALAETAPDAVLIEVPHVVQDRAVLWALGRGFHVLVGGPLATSSAVGERIRQAAADGHRIVEAGYECRYRAVWERTRAAIEAGEIGRLAAVRSIALYPADPGRWYYQQETSGGMPLTHMTYCFINPLRWILGDPVCVSAFANRVGHAEPDGVREETCVAVLRFPNEVPCGMTAGYVCPDGVRAWSVFFLGTEGALEVFPRRDALTFYRRGGAKEEDFNSARDAFEVQAETFLRALDGAGACRNPPHDALQDVRTAEAIVESARARKVVRL